MTRSKIYEPIVNEKIKEYNLKVRDFIKKISRDKKYGKNYREIIKKKWDMRKLNRKLNNKLPEKNFKELLKKI